MPYRVLDNFEPTPAQVREWGYDDNAVLMEQGEDLLLHDVQYIPVLLELAGDDQCPKQEYAFFILCQFTRERTIGDGEVALAQIAAAIPESLSNKGLQARWRGYVDRLKRWLCAAGPIEEQTAAQVAHDVLLGEAGRVGVINCSKTSDGWRFTLKTSITEHVDIAQSSGRFKYAR